MGDIGEDVLINDAAYADWEADLYGASVVGESAGAYGGGTKPAPLRTRTKQFALRIIRLFGSLPKSTEAQVIGKQLLRSATGAGANYREGSRSRSPAEFAAKMNIALMELEESSYWLKLLIEAKIFESSKLAPLQTETNELLAIFVTMINNAKDKERKAEGKKTRTVE